MPRAGDEESGTHNLENGGYSVPVGLGVENDRIADVVLNFFMEPQYSILTDGDGQPELQVFGAVNLQFESQ